MQKFRASSRLNQVLTLIVLTIIALFFLAHLTPTLAVRTRLIQDGYAHLAMTAKITRTQEAPRAPEHGVIYRVSPKPVADSASTIIAGRYAVVSFGLSFATTTWLN